MPPRAVGATAPHIDVLPCVHPNAAGLDIGADEIDACVPSDRDSRPVRAFATFTTDLHARVSQKWRVGLPKSWR